MPQITDEDLLEIYASAPVDEYVLSTIELIHPNFVGTNGQTDSIRVAIDNVAWDLRLEPDAPLFAGQIKRFEPLAVSVRQPPQEEGRLGEMVLSIDNVPQQYIGHIRKAATVNSPALIIYREYIINHNNTTGVWTVASTSGPAYKIGNLSVSKIRATALRIDATARFVDVLNTTVPRRTFSREDYPGLFA